jgi:geranylgeranyl pyrophosphate synthase
MKILQTKRLTKEKIEEAMKLLGSTNAKEKVLQLAKDLVVDARKSLDDLPESTAKNDLEELAEFVAARLY